MESWKKFIENLNEQEKPSSVKKFEYESQLPKDPAGRESMLMQATPEGMEYLKNKIPFSLKFEFDRKSEKGFLIVTVQSKFDESLVDSVKINANQARIIGNYMVKDRAMRSFFRSKPKAFEIHNKVESEKYEAFKKAWGHYWITKQKQEKAPPEKIKQNTKKATETAVKKAETKIKPEKIKKTPEVVQAKKAAVKKKAAPVNAPVKKKAASEVTPPASNDIVKKVQSGKWTKGGKSFPKANPEVINLIYKLQGLVGAKQDGVFGKETAKAIQRKYYGK